MAWEYQWIFFLVSAALCAIGFYKFVYFLSVGYGLSVAGLGIAYLIILRSGGYSCNLVTVLQCALFVMYGFRLSGFLLLREIKNRSYRTVLRQATGEGEKPMPVFVKTAIWLCVAVLYIAQTSPVFFRGYNGAGNAVWLPLLGAGISILGITLEFVADLQKTAQKKENPHMVATRGLYRIVRCPNYLGEILFWTGVFVGGLTGLSGAGQWITAILGYVLIVYIMFNGAQRLDRRQEKRCGQMEAYRQYADHTPIILPLIPLYHIGKYQ